MEIENAEDSLSFDRGSGVLRSVRDGHRNPIPPQSASNMGFPQDPDTPVYEDNTACFKWGNHVVGGRERAKNIDIRKHFAHEVYQNLNRESV